MSIFGQGEILFSNEKEEVNGLETAKIQRDFVGIRPGITFMLSKNFALETTIGAIGYTSQNAESQQNNIESDSNEFGISLDFDDLVFGLSYYF